MVHSTFSSSTGQMEDQTYERQRDLYVQRYLEGETGLVGGQRSGHTEEIRTTPLFSLAVQHAAKQQYAAHAARPLQSQYGLLGFHIGEDKHIPTQEPIFMNVAAPNSTFICGSQGSGKSFTLSTMLENCVLDDDTGKLETPVAGIVFHYDNDASGSVAEAAYLCSRGTKVHVLLSESNMQVLGPRYQSLKGAKDHLTVEACKFQSRHITIRRMKQLMAFSDQGDKVPLYMVVVQRILRDMALETGGASFNYNEFKRRLEEERFSKEQGGPLKLRLEILESFLDGVRTRRQTKSNTRDLFSLKAGELTIIDLSDPFVDAATACILFDICLSLAIQDTEKLKGLVVALDEAHKYMNQSQAAEGFSDKLIEAIRLQRHSGTRVIIATQEPTIDGRLLDLCSVTVVHFFKSPDWFEAIRKHLGAASRLVLSEAEQHETFRKIVDLQVGESLLFAPSSFLQIKDGKMGKLGAQVVKMKTRLRPKAQDGGVSVLAGGLSVPAGIEAPWQTDLLVSLPKHAEGGSEKTTEESTEESAEASSSEEVEFIL